MSGDDDATRELDDAAKRLADAIRNALNDGLTIREIADLVGLEPGEVRAFLDGA